MIINKFILKFAGIPLHSTDQRLQLPILVTPGPDWHHGSL